MIVLLITIQQQGAMGQDAAASVLTDVKIASSIDGDLQPAKIFIPPSNSKTATPLLVVLHSWSADYTQAKFVEACLAECQSLRWAVIHPNFRGPNRTPEACGSDLAVQDVLDAVAFIKKQTTIDTNRIYLVGTSGGGHMSLLMAGRAPHVWAGVSAWVPISDVAAWHAERTVRGGTDDRYRKEMELVCAGAPGSSAKVDQQFRHRSPLTHLAKAVHIPIDINTGINDGHTGSVPISQSLNAFNLLATTAKQSKRSVTKSQIDFMMVERKIDPSLVNQTSKKDAAHGDEDNGREKPILFRRRTGQARITIFDGSHEGDMPTAVRWLARQRKTQK